MAYVNWRRGGFQQAARGPLGKLSGYMDWYWFSIRFLENVQRYWI